MNTITEKLPRFLFRCYHPDETMYCFWKQNVLEKYTFLYFDIHVNVEDAFFYTFEVVSHLPEVFDSYSEKIKVRQEAALIHEFLLQCARYGIFPCDEHLRLLYDNCNDALLYVCRATHPLFCIIDDTDILDEKKHSRLENMRKLLQPNAILN